MPGGDKTGPLGLGPMTGRAAGYCTGHQAPGFMNPVPGFGRGLAWRRGFGRGWGGGFRWRQAWNYPAYPQPVQPVPTQFPVQPQVTKEQEIQYLEQELRALEEDKKVLEQNLGSIRKRLEELKK